MKRNKLSFFIKKNAFAAPMAPAHHHFIVIVFSDFANQREGWREVLARRGRLQS
jgi:hypothetical protein